MSSNNIILHSGRHLLRDHPLPAAAPHGERQVPGAVGGDGGPGDAAAHQGAAAGRGRALRGDGEGLAHLARDHVPAAGPALPRVGQDEVGGKRKQYRAVHLLDDKLLLTLNESCAFV